MTDLEKDRLDNYVRDMESEDLAYLVSILPSDLMHEELSSRERLKSNQLSAIGIILNAKNK